MPCPILIQRDGKIVFQVWILIRFLSFEIRSASKKLTLPALHCIALLCIIEFALVIRYAVRAKMAKVMSKLPAP